MDFKKTKIVQKRYNRFAYFYDFMEAPMSWGAFNTYRQDVWRAAKGKVLEVGVGTGKNFLYYPKEANVTAIDFSNNMLAKAKKKRDKLSLNVELLFMDAQNMSFPDNTFDTVVATCVFCTVPDPHTGFQEIRRVCKPDGQIVMLEHVRSFRPILGRAMDLFNPIVYGLVGTNINRDTVSILKNAGLKVVKIKELWQDVLLEIHAAPHK